MDYLSTQVVQNAELASSFSNTKLMSLKFSQVVDRKSIFFNNIALLRTILCVCGYLISVGK